MKNTLLTFFLLLSIVKLFACGCLPTSVADMYVKADFVATVKVDYIDKRIDKEGLLNLKIDIIELFKGEKRDSLKLWQDKSMCDIYTPKNTKWLIFAYNDEKGNISFGACNALRIDKIESSKNRKYSSLTRKLDLLRVLSDTKPSIKNEFDLDANLTREGYKVFKDKINLEKIDYEFLLYEISVNKNLSVNSVRLLKKYGNDFLDKLLPKFIKNNTLISGTVDLKEVPKETKVLMIYYLRVADQEGKIHPMGVYHYPLFYLY